MEHILSNITISKYVLKILLLLCMLCAGTGSEPPPANETVCLVEQLSCRDPDAPCAFSPGDENPNYGPALCSCPDSDSKKANFCYKRQPSWSINEPFSECKLVVGRQPDIPVAIETSVSNPSCNMSLETLCPQVGPMAGGTNMFIWGKGLRGLGQAPEVSFSGFKCTVLYSNATFIHCLTSNAYGTNAQGSYLRLLVDKGGGCRLEERTSFTYHEDPLITSQMSPSRSILSGGTNVTMIGDNLRSVSRVLMLIRAIYNESSILSASLCSKEENTVVCPSPRIDLSPLQLPKTQARKRRHVVPKNQNQNVFHRLRQKRQIFEPKQGLVQPPGLVVYAGLNAGGSTRMIQEWQVYQDPSFKEFEGKFVKYRPSWPDFDKDIYIEGENILSGVYESDYEVWIGDAPCISLDITDTQITCTPPADTPSPTLGQQNEDGDPALNVRVGNLVFSPGFVHYDMNVWNNSKVRYGVIAGLAIGIPIIICILVLIAVKWRISRKKSKEEKEVLKKAIEGNKNDNLVGDFLHPKVNLVQALPPELRAKVQDLTLHSGRVDQTDIKSREGNRGGVFLGWLLDEKGQRMMSVDVKTFKDDNVPFTVLKAFLEEAVKLKGLNHPNVQRLVGICIDQNIPKAITTVCELGDLKSLLYRQRLKQEGQEDITYERMVQFSRDIASGMDHLCTLGYVHEDLAARNCMVDKDYMVKVSDAALSTDIYELDYWRAGEKLKLQPVKWMSPESLLTGLTTSKSDVWSYGVTLWEVFTLGATPYSDVNNGDMHAHLRAGHRLSKPDNMAVNIYAELTHCWAKEPNKRPSFKTLYNRLSDLNSTSTSSYMNNAFDIKTAFDTEERGSNRDESEAGSVDREHSVSDHVTNDLGDNRSNMKDSDEVSVNVSLEHRSSAGESGTGVVDRSSAQESGGGGADGSTARESGEGGADHEEIEVDMDPPKHTSMSDPNMFY